MTIGMAIPRDAIVHRVKHVDDDAARPAFDQLPRTQTGVAERGFSVTIAVGRRQPMREARVEIRLMSCTERTGSLTVANADAGVADGRRQQDEWRGACSRGSELLREHGADMRIRDA